MMRADVKRLSDAEHIGPSDRQTEVLDKARIASSRRAQALAAAAGDDGSGKRWFIIRVAPHHENDVDKSMSARFIEHWLPLVKADQAAHGGRAGSKGEPIWVLAWPGYMFVRIVDTPKAWAGIAAIKNTHKALGLSERAFAVDDEMLMGIKAELALLKKMRGGNATDFAKDDLVKIMEGPMATQNGRIADLCSGKSEGRALVEVMIFGRAVPFEIDLAKLSK